MGPKRVRKSRKAAELSLLRLDMLPEDAVHEVLLRLPAKSIARFRAVCRSWHGLLSDQAFLRAHHGHAPRAVLLHRRSRARSFHMWEHGIRALPLGQRATGATPLHLEKSHCRVVLHGSCDGLLLLSHRPRQQFLVYNPTTREHAALPRGLDCNSLAVAGFYFHAPTAEYRVLCYKHYYTMREPPWERERVTRKRYDYSVAAVGRPEVRRLLAAASTAYGGYTRWKHNDAPAVLHGCLHWMRRSHRVAVFDTVSEEFRGMRGPVEDRFMVGRLFSMPMDDGTTTTLGASFSVEGERTVEVWVLQDYHRETWALGYRVDVGFMGGAGLRFKWMGIGHVGKSGDALFYGARRYGVYNLRNRQVVSAGKKIYYASLTRVMLHLRTGVTEKTYGLMYGQVEIKKWPGFSARDQNLANQFNT